MGDEVHVRNSTAPDRVVTFSKEEWQFFVAGVRDGEFEANCNTAFPTYAY